MRHGVVELELLFERVDELLGRGGRGFAERPDIEIEVGDDGGDILGLGLEAIGEPLDIPEADIDIGLGALVQIDDDLRAVGAVRGRRGAA
jgi:hypothetical protein